MTFSYCELLIFIHNIYIKSLLTHPQSYTISVFTLYSCWV